MSEETLFIEALGISDASRRAEFLDRECASDAALRDRLGRLLEQHERAGGFLGRPAIARLLTGADGAFAETVPSGPTDGPGTSVGPYKLLQKLGEGGMGHVWMAEQSHPVQRKVAVKLVKAGVDNQQVLARFEAERQALALMDHPNIAKVFDAGATSEGRPYFVMELVKGIAITQFCDERHLTPRQRLELFVPVCQAVQHAHQKGIIHRDIKPSNVLVAPYDGKPIPKVIDFGIVKAAGQRLTDKTLFTEFGAVVGTPEYMSPEQAELNQLDVDTRSDIYSLGVLLYELLTGTTPVTHQRVKGTALLEVLRVIREEEPPKPSTRLNATTELPTIAANRGLEPRKLSGLVRGELDWIVMKCLEKDRARRYETANAFAADVQRYLRDEPVQACPPSAGYRVRKFARRNRRALAPASVLALAALVGVGALAVSTVLVWRANEDLKESVNRERRAVAREQREAYFQRITVAHRELSTGNLPATLRALEECPKDLRGWEWYFLMRQCKSDPLILHDSTEVYGVAFSPDGERIASVGKDGKVKIWNSRTGERLREFSAHGGKAACSVVLHPDSRHLASAGADRLVKVWDLDDISRPVFEGPCDAVRGFGAAYTVTFRPPDGRYLAAGSEQMVRVWDWNGGKVLHSVPGPEHHSIPVAFCRDGRLMATAGPLDQGLNLCDAQTGRLLPSLHAHPNLATSLAFSPDGGLLASASLGRIVSVWNTTTSELIQTIHQDGNVLAVAFSPDPVSHRLVSAGEDKMIHIWDATRLDDKPEPREVLSLREHTDMCGCVAFSPDGWRLASASHDRTIRVWDATPLRADETPEALTIPQDGEIRSVAVSPDGQSVVSAGNGTHAKVWDATTGRVTLNFSGHSETVFSVAWHPKGGKIATAGSLGRGHSVKVWEAADGHEDFRIPADRSAGPYQVVAFHPDGSYLVTGQLEGVLQVWDARTGRAVRTLATHDREIRGLVFSRDGRHLASASGDGKVMIWDATRLDEKQEPRRLPVPARVPGPSVNVAFSPESRWLVTGGERNTIKIWDLAKGGELLNTLEGHRGEVYAIACTSDDNDRWMIASGGEDCTVKVWNGRTGKLLRTFRGHAGLVSSLAFSPDGKRLYSGSRDKTVKVWDLARWDEGSQ